MICKDCQSVFLDLLLDPSAPSSAAARSHIESCAECKREFASLEATFTLLDAWKAPEPSPYLTAAQVQAAYNVDSLIAHGIDGRGQTVVLIESFGDPTIVDDMARFSRAMCLPDADLSQRFPLGTDFSSQDRIDLTGRRPPSRLDPLRFPLRALWRFLHDAPSGCPAARMLTSGLGR